MRATATLLPKKEKRKENQRRGPDEPHKYKKRTRTKNSKGPNVLHTSTATTTVTTIITTVTNDAIHM